MTKHLNLFVPTRTPSPRTKRVEHEVRHILAEIFQRQDIPPVRGADRQIVPFPGPLTVTSVKISPDLRECRVGVLPLDPKKSEEMVTYFELATPLIRKSFAGRSIFRVVPHFRFQLDSTFATAERLEALLKERTLKERGTEEGNEAHDPETPLGDASEVLFEKSSS